MQPASCPDIAHPGIRLRPLQRADAEAWFAYLTLPQTLLQTSWDLRSVDELLRALERYESDAPDSGIRFAIIDAGNDALLGTIGFTTVSAAHRSAELAYDIHPNHWGRGIATDCCRAVVEWGLSQQGFDRIQAAALDTNAASIRVLEKCGFEREGKLRNFRQVRGQPRDFYLYSRISGQNRRQAPTETSP